MNAVQLIADLERAEVDGRLDAQTRRVIRVERFALVGAGRTGDRERIDRVAAEALRVARMWGVL